MYALRPLAGASNHAGIAADGVGSTARVSGLAAVASGTIAGLAGDARAPRTEVRRSRQNRIHALAQPLILHTYPPSRMLMPVRLPPRCPSLMPESSPTRPTALSSPPQPP